MQNRERPLTGLWNCLLEQTLGYDTILLFIILLTKDPTRYVPYLKCAL